MGDERDRVRVVDFYDPFWDQPAARQVMNGRVVKPEQKVIRDITGTLDGVRWVATFGSGPTDDGWGWTRVVDIDLRPDGIVDLADPVLWAAIGQDVRSVLANFEATRRVISALRGRVGVADGALRGLHRRDRDAALRVVASIWHLVDEDPHLRRSSELIASAFGVGITQANELVAKARAAGLIPPSGRTTGTTTQGRKRK